MATNLGAMPSNAPVFGARVRADRTAGDQALNSTTWANVDTGIDLSLTSVVAGDWVEVGLSATITTGLTVLCLDAVSLVAGAPVNNWSKGAAEGATELGLQAWVGFSGVSSNVAGSVIRQMVSGDLSAGTLTIRLRYRTLAAVNKTLTSSALQPLNFWAVNHRQP